jgi:hypothetical protein
MKNLTIYLLVLISCILNSGCKDEPTNDFMLGTFIQTLVQIRIVDKTGIDLLDPANPNSLKRFKVYYLTDGEKKLYSNPLMDAPGAYVIEKWPLESYYHLKIFLNSPGPGNPDDREWTTYLEFEDGTTATIKALFDVRPGYVMLDKASYNDVQVPAWDRSLNNGDQVTFELLLE